eukprot:jgi/Undpi1/3320/HiC_scaffold_15.g06693.m1
MAMTSYARYVLLVLLFVYANNMWARYLIIYLYAVSDADYGDDNMKYFVSVAEATGISTSEYGILVGYGFTLSYIISGLIMGRAVDIYNRKMIIFYGIIIWSFATACIGVSNNFAQLLLSRILLGVAESSATAASISLIADYFPAESLGQANGILVGGIYIGGGLSSLSIAMAEAIGWRGTAYSVAAFGFSLACLLFLTVKESVRVPAPISTTAAGSPEPEKTGQGTRDPEGDQTFTVKQCLKLMIRQPLFVLMGFGGMFRFMGGYTLISYLPDFYSQIYPDNNTAYSYLNASVVSIGGALSSYLGGYAADRWEKAGEKRARMYIAAIGTLLGVPAFLMVIVVPNFYASMFFLFLEYLFAECWYGPVVSVLQTFLPPRMRGVGFGCYNFCMMVAGSLMSYATGLVLDTYTSDVAIKVTLIVGICGMYLASAIMHLMASWFMPELNSGPFKGNEGQPLLTKV